VSPGCFLTSQSLDMCGMNHGGLGKKNGIGYSLAGPRRGGNALNEVKFMNSPQTALFACRVTASFFASFGNRKLPMLWSVP